MKISIDFADDTYHLMVDDGITETAPAGPRLFRGGNWPAINFVHDSFESAKIDAEKLTAYLDERSTHKSKRR